MRERRQARDESRATPDGRDVLVIVFRSCAPLFMSVMDYAIYNHAVPSRRSSIAMLLIVAGATVYTIIDRVEFRPPARAPLIHRVAP